MIKNYTSKTNNQNFTKKTVFSASNDTTYFHTDVKNKKETNNSFSCLVSFMMLLGIFLIGSLQGYSQIAQRGVATTATSTANTITIAKPAGVVVGDLLIANLNSTDNNNLSGNDATLAGWTVIDGANLSSNRRRGTILYKIATGAEPANYAFNVSNGSGTTDLTVGAIIAYSGVDRVTPFDVGPGTLNVNGGSATVTATAITTTTANTQIIMLGMADLSAVTFGNATWNTTSPGALTELYDVSNTSPSIGAAMLTKAAVGATGNGTVTISSSQGNAGILLALRQGPVITGLSASPACPGSSITITGTNLSGATGVTIGGTPVASITSNTPTQIIAVIGNGTTGSVVVTTPRGVATSAGSFTVSAKPTITLTSAAGTDNQTVCINTAITPITYNIVGGGVTGATISGLPTGTTGVYAANTFTITSTPLVTASGTFNYTITTTGPIGHCPTTATGTITVSALPTLTLTSPIGTTNQSVCNGSPITNITYTIGGSATGASTSGLPAGVTGSLAGSIYTISGTPTANGVFNYTVTTSGGSCPGATGNGTITVNPTLAANGGGSASVCIGANTTAFTNATPGGTWSTSNGAIATINPATGIATGVAAGTVNVIYTFGPCTASTSLTVNAIPTFSTNPSNSTIVSGANTSFTVVGTSSPTYTWEVSTDGGSTWSLVSNGGVYTTATTATLNLTAVPATMGGYRYRAIATNSCGSATSTSATLTVNIVYCTSTGGSTNGIKRVIFNTIDNTPAGTSAAVTYTDYTATNTTVTKGTTYNLSAYVDTGGNFTDFQSAYIDWNRDGDFVDAGEYYDLGHIKNVTFGLSGNSPYPITIPLNAVTGSVRMRIQTKWNSKTTGPCETGFSGEVEDYTLNIISNASACSAPTAQATALSLASANGVSISGSFTAASPVPDHYLVVVSTNPAAPSPTASTFYTIGSTVGAGYTVVDNDTNTSFLATGLTANTLYYIYVFSYNGSCTGGPLYNVASPLTGSITTANNAYCVPTSLINTNYISGITSVGTLNDVSNAPTGYSSNGYGNYRAITIARQIPGGGINININLTGSLGQFIVAYVDWNNDGDFVDAGETVYTTGTTATGDTSFGFVVPGAQAAGNYRMRIRTRSFGDDSTIDSCTQGYTTGETEDYTVQVQADCAQKITSVTNGSACGPTNTVNLSAVSAGATGFRWYTAETGGTLLQDVVGSGNWTTPSIGVTTIYYVTAYNGTCESLYRTPVIATIKPTTNIIVTPSVPAVCGPGDIISVTAGGDTIVEDVIVQDFESGLGTWVVATPTNTNAGADTPWSVKTSTYQPTTTTVWRPAVNSGAVATTGNKFAFTTSDYTNSNIVTTMTSPVINAGVYSVLTLTFDHYYSYYGGDKGEVQVSTNGGATFPTTVKTYTSDIGSASKFAAETIDLSAFAGQTNLKIRFVYTGNWDDGWALDNFKITGVKPVNTTFTWSGGSVNAYIDNPPTIPYVAQSVSTIYILANSSQLELPTWSFTATATLGNGCPVSKLISVTNNTNVWKGTTDNDWNKASNWLPAVVPTANNCVIIPSGTSAKIMNSPDALAKNLTVQAPTGNLELQAGRNLTVTDLINVEAGATFNVRNSANLIQTNNVANTGSINMQRTANIRRLDYVFWSSPVGGAAATFPVTSISPGTASNVIWKWLPTTPHTPTYASNFGNWTNTTENMVLGKGYIVRGPSSFTTTAAPYTATFTGIPNNGNISTQILRDTYNGANYTGPSGTAVTKDDDNWNLVGNPYPSAIRAIDFLTANPNIDGNIRLWTHGALPATGIANPFYQGYLYNYSATDFIIYNVSGSQTGPGGFSGNIGAGQGFFVLMNNAAATPGTVSFSNTMRSSTYSNSNFYKTTDGTTITEDGLEKNRIWLDYIAPSGSVNRILVGYIEGATQDRDRLFDATAQENVSQNFYSRIADEDMVIQGRALPFDQADQVPLGVLIPQNGISKIAVATVDGLFADSTQNIYLEDLVTGTIHDLKSAPYSFDATTGRYNNRFVLRYTNATLSNSDFDYANQVKIFANTSINVKSASQSIKEVMVYDILGKTLLDRKNINKTEVVLTDLKPTTTMVIVKVILDNNVEVVKKVIY